MNSKQRRSEGAPRKPGALSRVAGGAMILVGIPLLVLPGPGLLLIAAGLGMVGWGRFAGSRPGKQQNQPARAQEGPRQ